MLQLTTAEEIDRASQVCAAAFLQDQQATFLMPQLAQRQRALPKFYRFLLNYGRLYGKVYAASPRYEGVCVWLHSSLATMTVWRTLRAGGLRLATIATPQLLHALPRLTAPVFALHHHLIQDPHEYLFLLAVDPQHQGKGFARYLLAPLFKQFDQLHDTCYLETHTQKNVDLYKRYGFEIKGHIVIPKTPLQFWGMVRMPATKEPRS